MPADWRPAFSTLSISANCLNMGKCDGSYGAPTGLSVKDLHYLTGVSSRRLVLTQVEFEKGALEKCTIVTSSKKPILTTEELTCRIKIKIKEFSR